jgi:FlaA1/EpsC-like NDP-sugar epimerase
MIDADRKPFWAKLLGKKAQFALDIAVLSAAFVVAYLLRFEFSPRPAQVQAGLTQMPYVVLLQFAALFIAGVYNFIWRYIGMAEVGSFMRAAGGSFLLLLLVRLLLPSGLQALRVPLSIIFMDAVLAFGGVLSLRVLRRAIYERYEHHQREDGEPLSRKPVLLIGAGQAGVLAAREIMGRGESGLEVKGFVDDDPEKQGAVIQGVKVLGRSKDIPRLVAKLEIDHVVITMATASRQDIKRILDLCESAPVKVRIIPGYFEVLGGQVAISRIRDVEIEDLLGREPVTLEEAEVRGFLSGKTVMVTGAGGSIGSELARQVALFAPARLLLVERAEFVLFDIHRELAAKHPDLDLVPLVADVGDEGRMRTIFEAYRPVVVVHAAAHKHVPMMEWNPCEAVKNNVVGTEIAGRLAGECGAEAFVFISTDKAVKPTSVMGASKRMAELVVQALDKRYPTRYVAVRFGNVLGSTGSVIPIFRSQIAKGGPVTVTHPDMVRYFMTIPEASQLVLQAGAMGKGGEIFVLDMGEPVKIVDLAEQMITLSGLKVGEDIEIVFTGVRPGEKMAEELMNSEEDVGATRHPKIFIGMINHVDGDKVSAGVEELARAARAAEPQAVRNAFAKWIPEARLGKG